MLVGAAAAPTPCQSLTNLKLDKATITSAEMVAEAPQPRRGGGRGPAGAPGAADRRGGNAQAPRAAATSQQPPQMIPAHCRVQLDLKPSSDSLIKMEMWLPAADAWNGKFMGVGNGGFAGSIQGLNNEMPDALRRGYATAGTDTGHQGPGGEWAIGHPEKMIDFGYRATHEMTLKAKQIVKAFYDRSAQYSYFKGCSTGGRMAVMEAQRYPADYDGIIAGSLANRHIHMWTAGVERSVELTRHPEGAISREQATLVNDFVMNKCDTLHEGFLNDPRSCKVNFADLKCSSTPGGASTAGASANSCLTDAQLKTVETYYGGVKNSKGELIFSGQALGNPIPAQQPNPNGPGGVFDLVRIAKNDKNADWHTFDLDRDMKLLDEKIGYVDAVDPDLSKFKSEGGKLLMTHGWADTGITPENTVWYYEQVLDKMGRNQGDWMRLFMAPGMGHCGGGPGVNTFDSITALENWVEKKQAPETMMGIGRDMKRPLCPYPANPTYKGTGDLKDPASWVCKAPASTSTR
jgi:feruloyl esterase